MKVATLDVITGQVVYSDVEIEYDEVVITKQDVKNEARRRIEETNLSWYVEREVSGGTAIPDEIKTYCAEVRAASDDIEANDPIPADYADDKYWPYRLTEQ